MAGYERKTAVSPSQVMEHARTALPELVGLKKVKDSGHGATYSGAEGTVTLTAHRHGPYTSVVATTDRLRTSRLDYEVQRFLTQLPYEPGDRGGRGSGEPYGVDGFGTGSAAAVDGLEAGEAIEAR